MIDIFTLALTHGLMALASLLLISRDDLDEEAADAQRPPPWRRPPAQGSED